MPWGQGRLIRGALNFLCAWKLIGLKLEELNKTLSWLRWMYHISEFPFHNWHVPHFIKQNMLGSLFKWFFRNTLISDTLKGNACPFPPLLSHVAFCVLSLPGFKLASASQSAILSALAQLNGERSVRFCAQRISVYELKVSNFHNDAICTWLNHRTIANLS